jgi:hypothetical protein
MNQAFLGAFYDKEREVWQYKLNILLNVFCCLNMVVHILVFRPHDTGGQHRTNLLALSILRSGAIAAIDFCSMWQ